MSAHSPVLSIVIPSHHRADLLLDCLSSVVALAPPQTEIIVVDDGSPEAIISGIAHSFREVRVVRLAKSAGFCVAAESRHPRSGGEIIELLNDDTIVTPGWAEAALAMFASSNVGAVAPLVLQGSPDDKYRIRSIALEMTTTWEASPANEAIEVH